MFKRMAIVISMLLIAAASLPVYAQKSTAQPLRLNFVNSTDANVFTERLVYELFRRMGIEVSVTLMNMESAVESVNAGIYDGICYQPQSVDKEYLNLVEVPVSICEVNLIAIALQDSTQKYSLWTDFEGKQVGFLRGNAVQKHLPADVRAYAAYDGLTLLYDSLRNGASDVILVTDTSGREPGNLFLPGDLKEVGLIESAPGSIYLNKQYAHLTDEAALILKEMELDGTMNLLKQMKPLQNRTNKVVLHLSSYSTEMAWEQSLLQGIGEVLNQNEEIFFHNISLNAFRNTDMTLRENAALSAITVDFLHSPPDAVIVSDNEAIQFLLNNFNNILPNNIPLIFCGINNSELAASQQYGKSVKLHGVVESISAIQTARQMLELFPETKRIFVLNDDTLTGRRWKSEMQVQLAPLQDRVAIVYNENLPFENISETIAGLGSDTLVLCGSYFLDSENRYFSQDELQSNLKRLSPVPVFGLLGSSQGQGQLGGKYTNGLLQGEKAAEMLVTLLEAPGNSVQDYIETEAENNWIFDYDVMQQYGIGENRLPRGAQLLHKPPSLRESNPVLFAVIAALSIAGAIIILLLIFFVAMLRKRNKQLLALNHDLSKSRDETMAVKNRLQTILETAPIAYSLLVDDVVVESNRYYEEHIGTSKGQKNADKLKDKSRYLRYMEECRKNGFVGDIYWCVEQKNGQPTRYLYNIALTEYERNQAIVLWGVEIEKLEQQKDALNRAYHDLQQVIESTPMPIALICPAEGSFLFANSSWRNLFAVPESVLLSRMKMEQGWILSASPLDSLFEEAMGTEEVLCKEWEFVSYGGEPFDAVVYLKKIIYDGKECLVVNHKDLREEKAREQMLLNAAEKEREANRLKSHFLMNMSHEIRTPMNAIIGITQLAKPTDDAQQLFDAIHQISKSASVLLHVINDVLDLSLIEDGRMVLHPETVQLSKVIADVDAVVAVSADEKNIKRSACAEELVNDSICVDPSRLQQVLIALYANAVKFTGNGGSISLQVKETVLDAETSEFLFTVKDNGSGIEADKMSRLFKPFEQADDSITRKHGGAGLGLSIAKNIVEMMGGTIWAESEFGKGSTFYFTIVVPITKAAPQPAEAPEREAEAKELDFSALRILVVDDIEINRMIASELLGELGIAVEEAENGRQAADMVKGAQPGYYNLVFMDVQMPVLDGCSAVKEIRAQGREDLATLPIVAMTANIMPEDIEMILQAGMNGYIGKPVFMDQMIDKLAQLIQ